MHQRHRQTEQDRQDDGLIAHGEPFYKRLPKNEVNKKLSKQANDVYSAEINKWIKSTLCPGARTEHSANGNMSAVNDHYKSQIPLR